MTYVKQSLETNIKVIQKYYKSNTNITQVWHMLCNYLKKQYEGIAKVIQN